LQDFQLSRLRLRMRASFGAASLFADVAPSGDTKAGNVPAGVCSAATFVL